MIIKLKRATTLEWQNSDYVISSGELVVEKCVDGTSKLKVGDGLSLFKDLKYSTVTEEDLSTATKYSTKQPIVNAIGGIKAGTQFTNKPISEILDLIFYGENKSFDHITITNTISYENLVEGIDNLIKLDYSLSETVEGIIVALYIDDVFHSTSSTGQFLFNLKETKKINTKVTFEDGTSLVSDDYFLRFNTYVYSKIWTSIASYNPNAPLIVTAPDLTQFTSLALEDKTLISINDKAESFELKNFEILIPKSLGTLSKFTFTTDGTNTTEIKPNTIKTSLAEVDNTTLLVVLSSIEGNPIIIDGVEYQMLKLTKPLVFDNQEISYNLTF